MTPTRPLPFVLVHGAWHGAWCWQRVIAPLAARGHAVLACDLPAHGLDARTPAAFHRRPLDAAAYASEPSPVAATTLADHAGRVLETVDAARALGHERVVLVGHSMGGLAIGAAAEQAPDKVAALVYLCAFMPAPGVPGVAYIQAPENAGERVGPAFKADPAAVGALRLDTREPAARAALREAFYGDVEPDLFERAADLLTPDAPVAPFAAPMPITAARWGALPRHYVMCLEDMAIRPALQQRFVAEADALTPHNPTRVHRLATSHSPFLSQPQALVAVLAGIAG
jgi:pimeloyl-ACP methyl ester carboxylesterase